MNVIIPQRSQLQSFLIHEAPGPLYLHSKASPVSLNITGAYLDLSLGCRAEMGSEGWAEKGKGGLTGETIGWGRRDGSSQ